MIEVSAFRDGKLARAIAQKIHEKTSQSWTLMEFCGTHTVTIFKHGLKSLLPDKLKLISGPGCPVCVTPRHHIDKIIHLAGLPDSIVATYGDMMKVPGSKTNLSEAKARGADVRVVYSSYDAIEIAMSNRHKRVFFVGVGFETTAPSTASAIIRASQQGLRNFFVLSLHKRTPPVIIKLLEGGSRIDGFICPGHVCSIIGGKPLEPVAHEWQKPCVIAGFEPNDVLQAILMLIDQLEGGRSQVEIEYLRGVRYEGNSRALATMEQVFETCGSEWRGIGYVEGTGLKIREDYLDYDAEKFIEEEIESQGDPEMCRCGDVLKGEIPPTECPLFGKACTPHNPIGPCMVSQEGSCATYFQYVRIDDGGSDKASPR